MSDDPQNALERYERLVEERRKEMLLAIGAAHFAFSRLESCLWELYANAAQHHRSGVSNVVFYSPTSFETRLGIVDDLMRFLFDEHPDGQRLHHAWKALKNHIASKKNTRNQIAHGELLPSTRGNNTQIRLTPQVADLLRIMPHIAREQHPGMSRNDVEQFTKSVDRLRTQVVILSKITILTLEIRDGRLSKDDPRVSELWSEFFEGDSIDPTQPT